MAPRDVSYHYKWGEACEALKELVDEGFNDPDDGDHLEYKNPIDGGHTFLTMTCHSNVEPAKRLDFIAIWGP